MSDVMIESPPLVGWTVATVAQVEAPSEQSEKFAPVRELECPECFDDVTIPAKTQSNEILQCQGCGTDLEIRKIEGEWRLEVAPEEEEDWGE